MAGVIVFENLDTVVERSTGLSGPGLEWLATGAHHLGFWYASVRNVSAISQSETSAVDFLRALPFSPPND